MASEPSGTGSNRRIEERLEARLAIRFGDSSLLADAVQTYSANVGMGGLCVAVTRIYQPGDVVQIRIDLAEESYPMQAVVAWARPGFIGLRFQPSAPEHRKTITLIKKLMDGRRESLEGAPLPDPNKPFSD
jgi:hypothetical protein